MRIAIRIVPTPEALDRLNAIVDEADSPQRLVLRARAILMAADNVENKTIAHELGVDEHTVARWRRNFATHGLSGIETDAPRSGRPADVTSRVEQDVLRLAQQPGGIWSNRSLAAEIGGVSHDTIRRILQRHGLDVHGKQNVGAIRFRNPMRRSAAREKSLPSVAEIFEEYERPHPG